MVTLIINGLKIILNHFILLVALFTPWKYNEIYAYLCVSVGEKCLFFGKFGVHCIFFEKTRFEIRRFALLPTNYNDENKK